MFCRPSRALQPDGQGVAEAASAAAAAAEAAEAAAAAAAATAAASLATMDKPLYLAAAISFLLMLPFMLKRWA